MKKFLLGMSSAFLVIIIWIGSVNLYRHLNRPVETVLYGSTAEMTAEIKKLEDIKSKRSLTWREKYKLGVSYHQGGRYSEASILLEDFIKDKPEEGKAYETLGMSYYRLEKFPEAIEKWKIAETLLPEAKHLGPMITELERKVATAERIKSLEEDIAENEKKGVHSKDKKIWEKMFELSLLYLSSGESDKAINALKDASAIKKDNADIFAALAQAYAGSGDFEQAHRNMKKASRLAPKDEDYKERVKELARLREAIKQGKAHNQEIGSPAK